MQTVYAILEEKLCELNLPDPEEEALPNVKWGAFDELMTPAYWRTQVWQHQILGTYSNLRLGRSLAEEIAACLLGGYGMPAELGLAAYARLRSDGYLDRQPTSEELETVLLEPLEYQGSKRNYRFPRQKARYLAACLANIEELANETNDIRLRNKLADLPGIGPKTASWIVRNYRNSNSVAIIDVHILRAGRHIQLFNENWKPERHYQELENAFLSFAISIDTPASILDGLMWDQMRRMPSTTQRRTQLELPLQEHFIEITNYAAD